MESFIDTSDFDKKIRELAKLSDEAGRSLKRVADEILRLSTQKCPHDLGYLQSTGNVGPVRWYGGSHGGSAVVQVGYHTKYAARLHEHPEYHFQKGREGKWLESTIKNNLWKWQRLFGEGFEHFMMFGH